MQNEKKQSQHPPKRNTWAFPIDVPIESNPEFQRDILDEISPKERQVTLLKYDPETNCSFVHCPIVGNYWIDGKLEDVFSTPGSTIERLHRVKKMA